MSTICWCEVSAGDWPPLAVESEGSVMMSVVVLRAVSAICPCVGARSRQADLNVHRQAAWRNRPQHRLGWLLQRRPHFRRCDDFFTSAYGSCHTVAHSRIAVCLRLRPGDVLPQAFGWHRWRSVTCFVKSPLFCFLSWC